MAARHPKPPGNEVQPSTTYYPDFQNLPKEKFDCSCTNISIMQLFHEMKQEFPTVPDHVVNQCVIDNCHDRENCLKTLRKELIAYPSSAQAYPSHVLRGNQNFVHNKQPLKPTRPAPVPKVNCDQKNSVSVKPVKSNELLRNNISAIQNFSDMRPSGSDNKPNLPPQRPTTLSFHDPQQNSNQRVLRPVRTAPLPPIARHQSPIVQNLDQSFSSTSVQSPVSFSDSGESEISVNISLSPSSDRSRGPPTRRISAISIQPEPPYSREFTPQSPRSYTSLNLTLRKPSTTPQSPIDITAGPGLTYSSSSFDARRGYQKNFHITVTDQGGVFSASRIRPRSCYNVEIQHPEEEFSVAGERQNLRTAASVQNVLEDYAPSVANSKLYTQQDACSEIILRQTARKEQLAKALEQNRKKLYQVQQVIRVLTSPITPGESERLDNIIKRLRENCQEMLNEIEGARRSGLVREADVNESVTFSYTNSPINRPPRPSPPQLPYNYNQGDTATIAGQQISSQAGDENYSRENNADGGPPWTCKMCTFQNHPLLNKCECCENIRIIPGSVPIVPSNHNQPLFSRLSNNIANNYECNRNDNNHIHFNNAEPNLLAYPAVMSQMPPPNNPNFVMPGNS